MTLFLPAPLTREVPLTPLPQGPSQPAHLRLELVFQGLPRGPQVPAPQAGVQSPRPDVLVFDSNALGSIRGAQQVPGQKGYGERVRAETEPEPQEYHLANHAQVTDGETEADNKYHDWALKKPSHIGTQASNTLKCKFKQSRGF